MWHTLFNQEFSVEIETLLYREVVATEISYFDIFHLMDRHLVCDDPQKPMIAGTLLLTMVIEPSHSYCNSYHLQTLFRVNTHEAFVENELSSLRIDVNGQPCDTVLVVYVVAGPTVFLL